MGKNTEHSTAYVTYDRDNYVCNAVNVAFINTIYILLSSCIPIQSDSLLSVMKVKNKAKYILTNES